MMAVVTLWAGRRDASWPWGTRTTRICTRFFIQLVAIGLAVGSALLIFFLNEGDLTSVTAGLALGGFIAWILFDFLLVDVLGWKEPPKDRNWNEEGDALQQPADITSTA